MDNDNKKTKEAPKIIHENEGHILELIDEDVQSVNAFRSQFKEESSPVVRNNEVKIEKEKEEPTTKKETFNENGKRKIDLQHSKVLKDVDETQFRQYQKAKYRVRNFYKEQHEKQTMAYNLQARINFKTKKRASMPIWTALCKLSKLIDDSDPDTELSQIDHAIQTAEAIRADGKPRWMQLVGLIHDLGKILYFFDSEGQWDVVGDTFPVGCEFSKDIIFHEFFKNNPDFNHPIYSSKYGIYEPHCGLKALMLSWGHDEYMYYIAKGQSTFNDQALAMIRYHSFYPWHREDAYRHLMCDDDYRILEVVRDFNKYDLYSKSDLRYDLAEIKPYYLELIEEFFPNELVDF
ncbi:related to inositol oxygenase [Saccharomycodes ludwigii]|uniref:Inositol oxygenase n=1 Tax=Saccharomycodes ludwigii TaxID=36035 RepID=A0A376BAL5_9ASCO|nr:conserved putative inositol oxygenase [Saccharomycodes ludwigii]KAH3901748.1 conserved putative inositol oxygenase [Saccharomycodes ludwigii]SSD61702.1 related to inositol oxygenase [Saccharomycodes ludwigii]